jgi:hypothetical protein
VDCKSKTATDDWPKTVINCCLYPEVGTILHPETDDEK